MWILIFGFRRLTEPKHHPEILFDLITTEKTLGGLLKGEILEIEQKLIYKTEELALAT